MQHATGNTQHANENRDDKTIKNFTDLNTWQESHKLVISIYELTKSFPEDEKFGLTSQMRRAAVSITSNIAEGFGRRNPGEKMQFYSVSQASVSEVQNQLLLARDLGYSDAPSVEEINNQLVVAHKLLTGLIRSLQ